jgi:hypothetical protein
MEYPNAQVSSSSTHNPITEELVAAAIAGIVSSAQAQGQSLADLTSLVLEDDPELDQLTRQWLSEIVAEAWQDLAEPVTPWPDRAESVLLEAA